MMHASVSLLVATVAQGALPPGPGPFGSTVRGQPVPGALEFDHPKVCEMDSALNGTNATLALQLAIDRCGDSARGGVVVVNESLTLYSASLWLRSNLTLRVAGKIVGTATGYGDKTDPTNTNATDAPLVYTRRNSIMVWAHAGFLNGGRCLRLKDPLVGWDDCAEWSVLENVVLDGFGTLDAAAEGWWAEPQDNFNTNERPVMLDLLWIRGLTIRDLVITGTGYWTIKPTFCDNVRVERNRILTTGHNTDGCDPDSSWNVYIAFNTFDNGDDCIAIKAGKDWSGRMINISTRNVLAEHNYYKRGHGISIGSETSGWVYDVSIRDSFLDGTKHAVRLKSMRGRGGGIKNVEYRRLSGFTKAPIQLSLNYHPADPTNESATPEIRNITVADLHLEATPPQPTDANHLFYPYVDYLDCFGLNDSAISELYFTNVHFKGTNGTSLKQHCFHCSGQTDLVSTPRPCFPAIE
mmetsp:Transcript_12717/g.40325  ORF Transcript_12717/g.40325 Transcript_12717/m.40325 type:complete len:466 (+) Transcript_12717:48-1445(+)